MSVWATKKLQEICRPRQWPTLSKAEMHAAGIPVYGANGIIGFTDKPTHVSPTILIGCRGSCGTVHVLQPPAYANGNAMALDELDDYTVDLKYLTQFLRHRGFTDVTTGASQPQIVQRNLNQIEIPIPPLDEQRRIAAILDQADELKRNRQRTIDRLGKLGQSIFHEMFGDPVVNQTGYPCRELHALIDSQRPITYGILMPGSDMPGGVPYVRVVDIKNERVLVDRLKRTTLRSRNRTGVRV